VPIETQAALDEYVATLYRRRTEAVYLKPLDVVVGKWRPREHECHANVNSLCDISSEYTPARGWLLFDFGGFLDHVRFSAHSAVRVADGAVLDITPSQTSRPYPFISAGIDDADYIQLVAGRLVVHLDFYTATGDVLPYVQSR
jgi:hypothetical protein